MLTLSEIVELKDTLRYGSDSELHYHDVCPKPYFTLDRTEPKIQKISVQIKKDHCTYP